MTDFKQNPVSAVVWPWTKSQEDAPPPPSLGQRLVSKALWIEILINLAAIFLVGYLLVQRYLDKPTMAKVVYTVASIILLSAIFAPPVHAAIKKGFLWFGTKVGVAMGWILLVPFYYLVITPGHVIMTLKGKDPMCRKFPSDEKTYWVPRKPVKHVDQYKKQH